VSAPVGVTVSLMAMDSVSVLVNDFRIVSLMAMDSVSVLPGTGVTVSLMVMDSVSVLVNAFRTISLMAMDSGSVLPSTGVTVSLIVMDSVSVLVNDFRTVSLMAMDSGSVLVSAPVGVTVSLMVMDSVSVLVNAFRTVSVMAMDSVNGGINLFMLNPAATQFLVSDKVQSIATDPVKSPSSAVAVEWPDFPEPPVSTLSISVSPEFAPPVTSGTAVIRLAISAWAAKTISSIATPVIVTNEVVLVPSAATPVSIEATP